MSIAKATTNLADVCDVAYAMKVVGGKWKISIIWELANGKRERLSSLRRKLINVSEGVLIVQLKELERDGLIRRIAYPEVPPHVEYELTDIGQRLVESIRNMETWGRVYRQTHSAAGIDYL
jgi:DNA-binding HxlR family transcriptional regulator